MGESEYEAAEPRPLQTADDRREEWTPIYAGLRLLAEEFPEVVDVIGALVEGVSRRTRDMREDIEFFWSRLRSFLIEQDIDPWRAVLLEWGEISTSDGSTQRVGTVLFESRWFAFETSLDHPLGSVLEVTSWTSVDEAQARAKHGAEVDAALRVAQGE